MANNTQDITQEESIKWSAARLENERDELVEKFAECNEPRQVERITCHIAQISLRILRIEQHLEDFEDLKHLKSMHGGV